MNKNYRLLCQCIALSGLYGTAQADQIVSLTTTNSSFVGAGDSVNIVAQYQVSAPETTTEAGLGLRIHFNSNLLNPDSISLYPNSLQPYGPLTADTEDFDNDPLTDSFFVVGWLDFAAQWPGTEPSPLLLLDIQFSVPGDLTTSTSINLSASATAKNTGFQSAPLRLCRKPTLTITANTATTNEDGTSSPSPEFTIRADQHIPEGCEDLVISYTVTGSATAGDDFNPLPQTVTIPAGQLSTTLAVAIIDDDLVETSETLTLSLQNNDDYSLAANAASTLTINSEDVASTLPEVNLSVGKLSVTEGQGGSLLLHVIRTQGNLNQPLEVMIELGGTASANHDFHAFPGSITIPAGRTQAHAVLVLKDDADQEPDETLNISIAASANYQRGENSNLQLTIRDDELNQNTSLPVIAGQLANQQSPQNARQVPASSQWMLILMSFLFSGLAAFRLRAKKTGEL